MLTYYMTHKFLTSSEVEEIKSDPKESRQYYLTMVTLLKKKNYWFNK